MRLHLLRAATRGFSCRLGSREPGRSLHFWSRTARRPRTRAPVRRRSEAAASSTARTRSRTRVANALAVRSSGRGGRSGTWRRACGSARGTQGGCLPGLDAGVVVIAHGDGEKNTNPTPLRGDRQAVDEGVVGFPIGPHQELALCATPRNHVRAPWQNVACDRHHEFSLSPLSGCFKINLGGVPGST